MAYANILIFAYLPLLANCSFHPRGTEVLSELMAGALSNFRFVRLPDRSRKCADPKSQARLAILAVGRSQLGKGAVAPARRNTKQAQGRAIPDFLLRSLLFQPKSPVLTSESARNLLVDAGWLRKHLEVRILVAGFCDPLGSEECMHELAEQRGTAVKEFLLEAGVDLSQIVGVKGWEKAEPICESPTPSCQEMNRRGRIFVAGLTPARQ
jgi:outer membrane protein OmpA-like peptidoglycan-associated protein